MGIHDRKVAENNLRRRAKRQGLRLEKCRRRDPLALRFNTWQLVNDTTGAVVAAEDGGYGLTLDEIRHALTARRPFTEGSR